MGMMMDRAGTRRTAQWICRGWLHSGILVCGRTWPGWNLQVSAKPDEITSGS
jgi:hypothetical protein